MYHLATSDVGCFARPQQTAKKRNAKISAPGIAMGTGQVGHMTMAILDVKFSVVGFYSYTKHHTHYNQPSYWQLCFLFGFFVLYRAAHHKFQRQILGITWKDKVRNKDIRNQTKLQRMDLNIKERRLRWLGHVLRMEDDRIPKQAIWWQTDSCTRRRPGRPRLNWIDTVTRDLKSIGTAWEEAEQAAVDREDWNVWPNVSLTRAELRSLRSGIVLITVKCMSDYKTADTSQ